jgi:hypothetical protein
MWETFHSAEATAKRPEDQSNQGYMAEVMKRLGEILGEVDSFAESYTRMREMKLNK